MNTLLVFPSLHRTSEAPLGWSLGSQGPFNLVVEFGQMACSWMSSGGSKPLLFRNDVKLCLAAKALSPCLHLYLNTI